MIRLYLMGSKGFNVLKSLVDNGYKNMITDIVYAKDSTILNDYKENIIEFCKSNNIKYYNRLENVPSKKVEYSIAISWRWLIHDNINLIVLHDSLLPKYRGFAPLISALKNGEKSIGVTAIFANNSSYDTGPIIFQEKIDIEYPIKIYTAIDLISTCYQIIILNIFNKLSQNIKLTSYNQDHQQATYSLWLDNEDYNINWKADSDYIQRHIDAVGYPYLGAKSYINKTRITILDGKSIEDIVIENRIPGKVIFNEDKYIIVVCGKGLLKITKMLNEDGTTALPLSKFRTRFK